ncbi:hypothetical protein BKA62DRAFT_737342 [Auriculariales sp. MPI-PUGE-AT-0066]|nr:hypothetical protein BKA62DRAFT_737342 [Auriculariales sp. MPI-PUGE-AT-0066]
MSSQRQSQRLIGNENINSLPSTQEVDLIREREVQINALQAQNRTLRLRDVTNIIRPRPSPSPSDDHIEPAAQRVQTVAPSYALTHHLWLRQSANTLFRHDITVGDLPVDRSTWTEDDRIQFQLREIRDLLPDELVPHMKTSWFAEHFNRGMRQQVSNDSTRNRTAGHHQIFGSFAAHFANPASRLAHLRDEIGFRQGVSGERSTYDALNMKLHDSEGKDNYDIKTAFRGTLPKTCAVARIRGAASAEAFRTRGAVHIPRGEYNQRKYGIKHTTPGMIAAAITISRWALSSDNELSATGAETGIEYSAGMDKYLDILHENLQRKTPSIVRLFRDWDLALYGTFESVHGGTAAQAAHTDEDSLAEVRRQAQAEREEEAREEVEREAAEREAVEREDADHHAAAAAAERAQNDRAWSVEV